MPTPLEYLNRSAVVVVTGGSSGIGCSIIKAIQKLNASVTVCNLSRSKPGVFLGEKGVHLPTDLTDSAALAASAEQIQAIIADAEPGEVLLFNNSGFGDYGCLHQLNIDKQLKMIDLNVRALVDLTARLLPQMLERGGVIVNIASTAAFQPTPFMATYGATKAFVLNWSLALNEELRGTKVRALVVCPGPTRSNFFKAAGFATPPMQKGGANGFLDMTSDEVAQLTLRALAAGKSLYVTGWKNWLISIFGGKTPRVWVTRMGSRILRKMRLEAHRKENL